MFWRNGESGGMRAVQIRSAVTMALVLICLPVQAGTTLGHALDKAWERAVQARVAESRITGAEASRQVADSWFAAPPSIGLNETSDRFDNSLGSRERELELALPIWIPGQRRAGAEFARSDSTHAQAGLTAERWILAGQLRDSVWELAMAQSALNIARERLEAAKQLESDVGRRYSAGELARTDLLLSREQALLAEQYLQEAGLVEQRALARFRRLTGLDGLPDSIVEPVSAAEAEEHPRLVLAKASVEMARTALQVSIEDRRDPPELTSALVRTRDDYVAPSRDSVRLGVRVPFGADVRNAPRLAEANARLIQAEAELRQATVEVESERQEAFNALASAEVALSAATSRAALAGERLALQKKAFSLGELDLAEFIRVRASASEARLDLVRAENSLNAARARLNQSKGILP